MESHYARWILSPSAGYGSTLAGVITCHSSYGASCRRKDLNECAAVKSIEKMGAISAWRGAEERAASDSVVEVRILPTGEYAWKYPMDQWHPDEKWAE